MKILRYWKVVNLSPEMPVTYELVPSTEINSTHPFFDQIFEQVKTAGFSYVLREVTYRLLDQKDA